MKVSNDEVERIAKLSLIKLSESEIESYRIHLESVLKHMKKLDLINTEGVEPLSNIGLNHNVMRHDVPEDYINRDRIWVVAPVSEKQKYVVPQVVE